LYFIADWHCNYYHRKQNFKVQYRRWAQCWKIYFEL